MGDKPPAAPGLLWRLQSIATCTFAGTLSRVFLAGLNRLEVNGLDRFTKLLDERADVDLRERGLLTVSNHLSVSTSGVTRKLQEFPAKTRIHSLDDPLMWGAIPLQYLCSPNDLRWALASHDIVFKTKMFATFFSLGQTLPTHRLAHSPHGGLFQPTMTQAIRLLSHGPFNSTSHEQHLTTPISPPPPSADSSTSSLSHSPSTISDPFTDSHLTYTTNGTDSFPAPSAYYSRRHSWLHIYPEGRTHQRSDKTMRYFKWGVARLILEAEPAPALVPVWIEGFDQIMHESRTWPRFVPRAGKKVSVTFGEVVDTGEGKFGELRERWKRLVSRVREGDEKEKNLTIGDGTTDVSGGHELGVLTSAELRYGDEAVKLREECTFRVREEVLKVRRTRGLPDEDPKWGLMETWKAEGETGKRDGKMQDGSWVRDT